MVTDLVRLNFIAQVYTEKYWDSGIPDIYTWVEFNDELYVSELNKGLLEGWIVVVNKGKFLFESNTFSCWLIRYEEPCERVVTVGPVQFLGLAL